MSLIWFAQDFPANKKPFLNHLAQVILVHNSYCSTNTCFHMYSCEYTCSACCHEFWTSLTWDVLGQIGRVLLVRVITWKTHDFIVNLCRHTKFVYRIQWIHVRKHVNWASWPCEFTYRTCEITGVCLLALEPIFTPISRTKIWVTGHNRVAHHRVNMNWWARHPSTCVEFWPNFTIITISLPIFYFVQSFNAISRISVF